jgi:hypothetical protein
MSKQSTSASVDACALLFARSHGAQQFLGREHEARPPCSMGEAADVARDELSAARAVADAGAGALA